MALGVATAAPRVRQGSGCQGVNAITIDHESLLAVIL